MERVSHSRRGTELNVQNAQEPMNQESAKQRTQHWARMMIEFTVSEVIDGDTGMLV